MHSALIVAADTEALLKEKLKNRDMVEQTGRITRVHVDEGRSLKGDLKGHEHFGYKDGISQPGVKDFHREDAGREGFRDNHAGTELIEPGDFVFGHKSEQVVTNGLDKATGLAGKASIELAERHLRHGRHEALRAHRGRALRLPPSISTQRLLAGGEDLPNEPIGS
ncbi:hypothetical protein ACFVH0_00535 [Streptomyces sp. NPDC127117]|uniref:hypothetical protein n=1 Tax=Streptomyces sp. NPDC127117 TaxID=3345368 RepID=UPI003629C64E